MFPLPPLQQRCQRAEKVTHFFNCDGYILSAWRLVGICLTSLLITELFWGFVPSILLSLNIISIIVCCMFWCFILQAVYLSVDKQWNMAALCVAPLFLRVWWRVTHLEGFRLGSICHWVCDAHLWRMSCSWRPCVRVACVSVVARKHQNETPALE